MYLSQASTAKGSWGYTIMTMSAPSANWFIASMPPEPQSAFRFTHSGAATRSSTIGRKPLGPSAIPLSPDHDLPAEIAPSSIPSLIEAFASAARRAAAAGFDMVELHGAHGYLLNQFFSPLTNIRSDEYGGSREGRLRFPLETVEAVRSAVGPNIAVFYRLGADDGVPGGLTVNDACWAAPQLARAGVDAIDVSAALADPVCRGIREKGTFARFLRQ